MNQLKLEARRAGEDVIDLRFGNPDVPSSRIVVDKLVALSPGVGFGPSRDRHVRFALVENENRI